MNWGAGPLTLLVVTYIGVLATAWLGGPDALPGLASVLYAVGFVAWVTRPRDRPPRDREQRRRER